MTKEKTEAKDERNIYQRLHAVMQEVSYVQKDPKKEGLQYRAVSHDAVTAKVRPSLVSNGVIYFPQNMETCQDGNRTKVKFNLRFLNVNDPTDFIDIPTFGYGIDTQDKGPGKAISYGVKYALLKALGLETGDDPENDSIEHVPGKKPVDAMEIGLIETAIKEAKNPEELSEAYRTKLEPALMRMTEKQKDALRNTYGLRLNAVTQAPLANGAHQ